MPCWVFAGHLERLRVYGKMKTGSLPSATGPGAGCTAVLAALWARPLSPLKFKLQTYTDLGNPP